MKIKKLADTNPAENDNDPRLKALKCVTNTKPSVSMISGS